MDLTARRTDDLFHYTSADLGIFSILAQGSIRLGPYESTNDPEESRQKSPSLSMHQDVVEVEGEISSIWEQADWWLRRYVKIACFTQDFDVSPQASNEDALRGWAHPALWAHYGADHSGVCLRFSRAALVEQFEQQLGQRGRKYSGSVDYESDRFSALPVESMDVAQVREFGVDAVVGAYVGRHHRALFFTKHHDWSNEYEYRLMLSEASLLPVYLDISKCLTGVFLGDAFPATRLDVVQELTSNQAGVDVSQVRYQNGQILRMPVDLAARIPLVKSRREGAVGERLSAIEAAQRARGERRSRGEDLLGGIPALLMTGVAEFAVESGNASGLNVELLERIHAVPPKSRGRAAGVPGEVVDLEQGFIAVVNAPTAEPYVLVAGLAVQLLDDSQLRFHGYVSVERTVEGERTIDEPWRYQHECPLADGATHALGLNAAFLGAANRALAAFTDDQSGR